MSLSLPSSSGNLPLLVNDDILKVRGVIFDHVSFTSSDLLNRTAPVDDICNLWGFVSRPEASCPYLESYKAIAFVHVPSFGVSYDDGRYRKQCKRAYIRLLNKDAALSRQEQEDANVVHAQVIKNCVHNRRFVITTGSSAITAWLLSVLKRTMYAVLSLGRRLIWF
jgi:hypothetical protein